MLEQIKQRCSPNWSLASLSTEDSPDASWSSRNARNTSDGDSAASHSRRECVSVPMPNLGLKVRYSHYENASVYLALANLLILPENPKGPSSTAFRLQRDRQSQGLARRISCGMRCKYPAYIFALLYLGHIRKRHAQKLKVTLDTFQRLVTAAIVVATKFCDDLYYSNEHYAKELGIPLETLNSMEVSFLTVMNFNLRVDLADYRAAHRAFNSVRDKCNGWEKKSAHCPTGSDTDRTHPAATLTLAVQAGVLSIDKLDAHTAEHVKRYMISRESPQGIRYDSEEEHLLRSDLHIRARTLHKLQQQCVSAQASSV